MPSFAEYLTLHLIIHVYYAILPFYIGEIQILRYYYGIITIQGLILEYSGLDWVRIN
jgi:hypothetical protein